MSVLSTKWRPSRLMTFDKVVLAAAIALTLPVALEFFFPRLSSFAVLTRPALFVAWAVALGRLSYAVSAMAVRQALWRVRHRMIAVFLFVGVIPLTVAFAIASFGLALMFGPVAAYIVTTAIEQNGERLHAAAESLGWQLRASQPEDRRGVAESFVREAMRSLPGLMARFDTPAGPAGFPAEFVTESPPAELENYRGIVRRGGQLFLAAYARYEPGSPSVLLMAPASEENRVDFMRGFGVLETAPEEETPQDSRLAQEDSSAVRKAARRARALQSVELELQRNMPPPMHPFDYNIAWPAQVRVLSWETGKERLETAFFLRTRTSAVFRRIFANQSPQMERLALWGGYFLGGVFAVALVVSSIVAVSLTRTMTSAVNDLYIGTQHVNAGDFSHRIPLRGNTQLTELAHAFNNMTASIEKLIEESKERERLQSEIEIAREVQAQLFPKQAPQSSSLEMLGVCRPAQSVSGDFYDYLALPAERVALAFGDVSGKGISAALVMAAVHSTVRTELSLLAQAEGPERLAASIAQLVTRVNAHLCQGTSPDKFSTLFLAAYDERSSTLAYTNAGHLPPLILREGELIPLEVNGMVVGAFPHSQYESSRIEMRSGDLLVAFTDGVTEPENAYQEEFGEERLRETLRREAHKPIREIIEAVMREVDAWTGKPGLQDDMTMLVARRF